MIPSFGHHIIPLLPVDGSQGGMSAKAMLSASKEVLRTAEQINRVLKLACRVETALVPLQCDFFSHEPGHAKVRGAAWSVIKETTSLRWILPSSDPELIRAGLPADWIGKGYRNVCFGAIAGDPSSFHETTHRLNDIPCHFRMLFLPTVPLTDEICDHLGENQWIVAVGDDGDEARVDNLRSACQSVGASFLSVRRDGTLSDLPEGYGLNPSPEHPFGPNLQLRRPTNPDLRSGKPTLLVLDDGPPRQEPKELYPLGPLEEQGRTEPNYSDPELAPAIADIRHDESAALLPAATDSEIGSLSDLDRKDFARLDTMARRGVAAFVECGLALAEIHDRKLWRAGDHPTWEGYLRSVLGMSKPHAHRLVQAAKIAAELSESLPNGNDFASAVRPACESQLRPLCRLKDADQRTAAWTLAIQRAEGQPTAKVISEVVAELMAEKPLSDSRPTGTKQRVAEIIQLLREFVSGGRSSNEITEQLDELESLLKLK